MKVTWNYINIILGENKNNKIDEIIGKYLGKENTVIQICNSFGEQFTEGVYFMIHGCQISATTDRAKNM